MKEMAETEEIERKVYSIFANVASSIGYSDLHGKIIAVLLVEGKPLSLQELAQKTKYSSSMISLSLDFLEVLSVVKRVKKTADRKLYIELCGDLLESLKKAIFIRVKKSIVDSFVEFEESKKKIGEKNKKVLKTIEILEKEIKRLEKYVNLLSNVKIP